MSASSSSSSHSHSLLCNSDRVLLSKILSNILNAPDEPKFRRFRWSAVEKKLQQPNICHAFVTGIGFMSDDDDPAFVILPKDTHLSHIQQVYHHLTQQQQQQQQQQQHDEHDHKNTDHHDSKHTTANPKRKAEQQSEHAHKKQQQEQDIKQEELIPAETHDMVITSDYVFFWRPPGWPGQWTYSPFTVDGQLYTCAEQFMMSEKARLFNDESTRQRILSCSDPSQHKKLGRAVQNFDERIWKKQCQHIVEQGNYHKFTQNPELKKALLATSDKLLVEASPLDKIWGIGLKASDAMKLKPGQWKGENLLGKALMNVRAQIRKEEQT